MAEEIGDGGGGTLKKVVTDAVNEFFAPIRARRVELAADPGYLLDVLRTGNAHSQRGRRCHPRRGASGHEHGLLSRTPLVRRVAIAVRCQEMWDFTSVGEPTRTEPDAEAADSPVQSVRIQ